MSSLRTGLFLVVIFVLIILLWLAAYLLQKRLKAPEPETSTVLPGGEIDTKVKFKEPEGWQMESTTSGACWHHPSEQKTSIDFLPEEKTEEAVDNWDGLIAVEKEELKDYWVVRQERGQLRGMETAALVASYSTDGMKMMRKHVVVKKDREIIMFTLTSAVERFDDNLKVLQQMVDSHVWRPYMLDKGYRDIR